MTTSLTQMPKSAIVSEVKPKSFFHLNVSFAFVSNFRSDVELPGLNKANFCSVVGVYAEVHLLLYCEVTIAFIVHFRICINYS